VSYGLNFAKVFSSWRSAEQKGRSGDAVAADDEGLQQRLPLDGNVPMSGWLGVDLDGTLAYYSGWKGPGHMGKPIPAMAVRVRDWLAQGREVRIFTARACELEQMRLVQDWCEKHFGVRLAVTNIKDFDMIELWDDRCVQVQANTGKIVSEFTRHH
jgi:hypothetical protein